MVLAVAFVVSGCTSDDSLIGEPLDLDDDAVPTEDGSPLDDVDGAGDVDGDDGTSLPEGDAYPPLPPLEPDPDLELPIEAQVAAAEAHARVYELTQSALATSVVDRADLERVMSEDLADALLRDLDARPDGHVSWNPDTRIQWVRFAEARDEVVVIQECRVIGPRTGTYDSEGQFVGEQPAGEVARVFQTIYEPDGSQNLVAVSAGVGDDEERCRA